MTGQDFKDKDLSGSSVQIDLRLIVQILATLAALSYLLSASYPPAALGAVVAIFFAIYIWLRIMMFFQDDRFTPKRTRVGMTWALIGLHPDTNEFDARPVRVYFALLTILFAGLILRPFVDWILR